MNLWNLYQEYVVELDPVLWEMGRVNGVHIDNEARLSLLSEMNHKIDRAVDAAQAGIPDALFPLKRYVKEPKTDRPLRPIQVPHELKTCGHCGAQGVTKGDHTARKGGKGDIPWNACYKADITLTPGFRTEYDMVLQFNPGSDDQLKAYAMHFHHKMVIDWKTDQASIPAKHLAKLASKYKDTHPVYGYAAEIRKVRKARGYAEGWAPDEKGLAYGHFKHVPETLRLSQAENNFMNVSHRGDAPYAEELRRVIIAPPGYMLLEADSSSVEAVMTGWYMHSPDYMKLATKGIHAWWAIKKLGLEYTPENIKRVKNPHDHAGWWTARGVDPVSIAILYETKKRTVHGVSYGMGAHLLFELYPQFFANRAAAQAEIEEFYLLVPDLKNWHEEVRKLSHKQGYLVSPWGFKNYYYRVFSYDWKTKSYKLGEDAKAVVAFLPQHSNGMFQRKNLVLIDRQIKARGKQNTWKMTAIGHVHDSNGLRVPEDDQMQAAEMLAEVMTRPIPEMDNLQIGVQVKAGKDWANMRAIYGS